MTLTKNKTKLFVSMNYNIEEEVFKVNYSQIHTFRISVFSEGTFFSLV